MKGQVKTAFYLIIDHRIRDHIIKCTEEEAFRVLGTKRELDATKLDAFIALLYARCAYQAKNLDFSYLWNKIWRPAFFSKTMSRNDFAEIIRFIRFDKNETSQRLRTNKFIMKLHTVDIQYVANLQKIHKIAINLVHTLLLYKKSRGKNHAIKLSTSSDSLLQKTCQVEDYKDYKITKICLRCGKYLCDKCTFDNKIICKKVE